MLRTRTVTKEDYINHQGVEVIIFRFKHKLNTGGTGIFEVKKFYSATEWHFRYTELTKNDLESWGECDLIASAIMECEPGSLTEDTIAHWLVVEDPSGGEGFYPLPKLIEKHSLLAGDILTRLA